MHEAAAADEHRVRDLTVARRFAQESLERSSRPAVERAGRHRLDRIDRKLERLTADQSLPLQFVEPFL